MANKVNCVKVANALTGTGMLVSWQPNVGNVLGYNVYRGLSNDGAYTQIATGLSVNFYLDNTAYQGERTDYWYYVTAVDNLGESEPSEGVTDEITSRRSKPSELTPIWERGGVSLPRILSHQTRLNELILRRDGALCDLWVLKTAGIRCPTCYDPARMQAGIDDCPVCFGTSWQGGYERFPGVLFKIEPYTVGRSLSEAGEKWNSPPRSWSSPYPPVQPGDVLVRRSNNFRYEFNNIGGKIVHEICFRQEFDLVQIQRKENPGIFLLGTT